MCVLETNRLRLRRFTVDDTQFIFDLLNQPSFLRYIGDKGVRTAKDARQYILDGPVASYAKNSMKFERMVRLSEDEPEIKLFSAVF